MKKSRSLLQPHAGQIVGILRMLGLDEKITLETSNMTSAIEEVFSKDEETDSETSNVTPTDGKLCRI